MKMDMPSKENQVRVRRPKSSVFDVPSMASYRSIVRVGFMP